MHAETALFWNPIMRQSLVNAPHRMNRREGTTTCPFCADITAGRVDPQTQVWLHPNDFPPLQQPIGEAYVVIYSRDHDRPFMQLSVDEVNAVTRLWRDLYTDLAARYATVMIFENSGESIGQTQHHPHGQAYGVSIIPPRMEREHALAGALARFVFSAIPNLRTLTPCPYVELEAPLHTRVYTTVPCTQG